MYQTQIKTRIGLKNGTIIMYHSANRDQFLDIGSGHRIR